MTTTTDLFDRARSGPPLLLARSSERTYRVVLFLIVFASCARVASTYHVFSETWDEGLHIATGLQWLDEGKYTYEIQQPPLSQIATAIGPFLDGRRTVGRPNYVEEGQAILYGQGAAIMRTLTLGRIGILPFLVFGIVVVAAWSRHIAGNFAGLTAAMLFGSEPTVLAHAGLANTDLPCAVTVTGALFAFVLWLEKRTPRQTILLGLGVGLALMTKFSSIPFLGASFPAIALAWWRWEPKRNERRSADELRLTTSVGLAALTVVAITWALYRFSVGTVSIPRFHISLPFIAPELYYGIREVAHHNSSGHLSYLLGETREAGWWYYFPVALAVKSTIPLLLLALTGVVASIRPRVFFPSLAPAVAAVATLGFCLTSHINIGVRHVLPLFGLFAVLGGYAGAILLGVARDRFRSPPQRTIALTFVACLLAWQSIASFAAHPDYLAYFNPIAGRHPDRVLVSSDLDWGQDLLRLRDVAKSRGIDSIAIGYFGSADVRRYGIPGAHLLQPNVPTMGWIALSEGCYRGLFPCRPGGYGWLDRFTPVQRVGKTFRLYYVSDADASGATSAGEGARGD